MVSFKKIVTALSIAALLSTSTVQAADGCAYEDSCRISRTTLFLGVGVAATVGIFVGLIYRNRNQNSLIHPSGVQAAQSNHSH